MIISATERNKTGKGGSVVAKGVELATLNRVIKQYI